MRRTDGPFPVWEIVPGELYQRGKLTCAPEVKAAGLRYYGITQAIAMAPPTPDPDLTEWFNYTHFPIADGVLRKGDELRQLALELTDVIIQGGCVLTMCNAGRNRSGLLSALVLRELWGVSGREAVQLVRRERPEALANPRFVTFLGSLA